MPKRVINILFNRPVLQVGEGIIQRFSVKVPYHDVSGLDSLPALKHESVHGNQFCAAALCHSALPVRRRVFWLYDELSNSNPVIRSCCRA
jgi:hypothetical protein